MVILLKLLAAAASVASTLLIALAAVGDWVYLATSLPLIVAVVGTTLIYRHRATRERTPGFRL